MLIYQSKDNADIYKYKPKLPLCIKRVHTKFDRSSFSKLRDLVEEVDELSHLAALRVYKDFLQRTLNIFLSESLLENLNELTLFIVIELGYIIHLELTVAVAVVCSPLFLL